MIQYLCLIYLNLNQDKFDPQCTPQTVISTIDAKSIESTKTDNHHCYLENIINKYIHIWRFKCTAVNTNDLIGIRKVGSCLRESSFYFDEGKRLPKAWRMLSTGYGMFREGYLTNPQDSANKGRDYASRYEQGDIIEMKLDCNKWILSYKINDTEYGKAFGIDPDFKYSAAITLRKQLRGRSPSSSYTLVSYQQIY